MPTETYYQSFYTGEETDEATGKSHTHPNKAKLDRFTQDISTTLFDNDYTVPTGGAVSKALREISGVGVAIVTYGESLYSDIETALSEGKYVLCQKGNYIYMLSEKTGNAFGFIGIFNLKVSGRVSVNINDVWTEESAPIDHITASDVDIGVGAPLGSGEYYFVFE